MKAKELFRASWLAGAAFLCLASASAQTIGAPKLRDAVGGGFTDGGLNGQYFRTASFSSPAFARRDVRIDFNWGATARPGGSRSGAFASVGTDNYSIRWTGRLVARHTETYRFFASASDSFVMEIKPVSSSTWAPLLNISNSLPAEATATYPMVEGQRYDVRIAYTEVSGDAFARLSWSSPSTPREVISPAVQASVNMVTYNGSIWASAVDAGRSTWEGASEWDPGSNGAAYPAPRMDVNGNPAGTHFGLIVHEMFGDRAHPMMRGTMLVFFGGRAETIYTQGNLRFENGLTTVNGADFYNPATNQTTLRVQAFDNGWNITKIGFAGARRGPLSTSPPGITGLKMMMPTAPGATTTLPTTTIFHPKAHETFARFTNFRINMNTNNRETTWSQRTPPSFFSQRGGRQNICPVFGPGSSDPGFWTLENGMSWEHQVMFCNELGKDMYIDLPHLVNDDYMRRVANLIRFGSDGVNPYTAPQANPVYPPLNSNLKLYIELGNELWNWGSVRDYPAFHTWRPTIVNEIQTNAANARIYNFDNLSTSLDANGWPVEYMNFFHRRTLLRTYQMGEIFRSVFGSSEMITRVRPIMYGWYNNTFGVQERIYSFAENYFNNATGNHVPNADWSIGPRPMNAYVYGGGGGAHYFGSGNNNGFTNALTEGSAESPAVSGGYNPRPSGGVWTFTGPAGIARPSSSLPEIPPAYQGSQMAYISRQGGESGSASVTFTAPSQQVSNVYGLAFRAVSRRVPGSSNADQGALRVFVNNVQITAGDSWMQGDDGNWSEVGFMPLGWDSGSPWFSRQGWFFADLHVFTKHFNAAAASQVTVRFEFTGTKNNSVIFLDDIRLTSVDAIFGGGVPGAGQAFGQVTSGTYDFELFGQSSWAQAYGLEYMTYEGGWSLGGDNGGSFVQNWAKYFDPRARQSNIDSMNSFHRAGGFLPTFGTYNQFPQFNNQFWEEGMLNSGAYPLMQGIDRSLEGLPMEPENGTPLPAFLLPNRSTLSVPTSMANPARPEAAGQWTGWNVVVNRAGLYRVTTEAATGSQMRVIINGATAFDGPSGSVTRSLFLTKGIHNIRVMARSSGLTINRVVAAMVGAPANPNITSITESSGQATVTWTPVTNATRYRVRYGEDPLRLNRWLDAGSSTSAVLPGLVHGATYYVEVVAEMGNLISLPSATRSFTALVDGLTGPLATWDFTGLNPNAASQMPSAATSRVVVLPITRGPGLAPSSYGFQNVFQIYPAPGRDDKYSQTLSEAVAKGDYVEFSVAPRPGTRLNLDTLRFWVTGQHAAGGGIGVQYKVGSGDWSAAQQIATFVENGPHPRPVLNMGSVAALQDVRFRVVFRIYLFGNGQWNFAHYGNSSDSPSNRLAPAERPDIEVIGRLATVP